MQNESPANAIQPDWPLSEVEAIQNPALGAHLLWRMGISFQASSSDAPQIDLHFLVLPLLLHAGTLTVLASTNPTSGLSKFAHKMLDNESELITLNARAVELRELTLASLSLGVSANLLLVDHDTARIYSLQTRKRPKALEGIKKMERGAERLGLWFAQLPREQVFSTLRINY